MMNENEQQELGLKLLHQCPEGEESQFVGMLLGVAALLIVRDSCCAEHCWGGLTMAEQALRNVFAELHVRRFGEIK